MQVIVDIVLPVFGLLAVGYGAARTRLLGPTAVDGLSAYVFNLATPALVFRAIVESEAPDVVPWGVLVAYFIPTALVWAGATVAARRLFGLAPMECAIAGISSAYANTVMLGFPLVLITYPETGALPLVILITFHLPLMTTAGALHLEIARGTGGGALAVLKGSLVGLLTHPIVAGLLIGVVWRLTGFAIPGFIESVIGTIADTAIGCALIAMGLTLDKYEIAGAIRPAAMITGLKLVVQPALVWLCATEIANLPAVWVGVLTIFASAPVGVNPFIFATRYRVGVPMVSSAIALSTVGAVVTITTFLYFLTSR